MAGRLDGNSRKLRDAVSAKLAKAQKADGMGAGKRNAQNKRVADKIAKKKGN